MQIIEHPTSQEKEIWSLVDLHEKLVLWYSKNESDEDWDDSWDDDMSY